MIAPLAIAVALSLAQRADPFAGLPGVEVAVPVGTQLSSAGVPALARAVKVKLAPEAAMRWVLDAFRRADLFVPPHEKQFQLEGAPQITGYDPDTRRSYTAIFRDAGKGSTLIILGTADLGQGQWVQGALTLPVLPGAQGALESSSESGKQVSYSVAAEPAEVDDYYRFVLPAAGWKASAQEGLWTRAGEELSLERAPRAQAQTTVVVTVRRAPATGGNGR